MRIAVPGHDVRSTLEDRDNLRRSADELRVQLAKDEKALLELDEIT